MTDRPPGGGMANMWRRLRRRKVVQWGVAYCAGAWGLLQGLAYVSSTFDWPRQIQQFATLSLLVGLPVVLVIAWYHGDRGQQRVAALELAILTLLFLIGGGIFWLYGRSGEVGTKGAAVDAAAVTSDAPDARPSIAVLPFANRSHDPRDAYFVDGIHDDILTQLTKIGALKVIARTSVEQFRATTLTTREIGERLGVTRVLEGGVQRSGDRVRVTVQLTETASDAHLWAESYDRDLTVENIFTVQSEVANAIAAALRAALTPAEKARIAEVPTHSLAAWEAYQVGRQRLGKRASAALAEAAGFFRLAIERDPTFALAYVGLADATWLYADYSNQPIQPAVTQAEEFLGQALRLDPNLAEARVTLAKFAQDRREFERAESLYLEAIDLNPNYPTAHHWYSQLLGLQGRDDEAFRSLQRAVELDPLSPSLQSTLAWALSGFGRFDEALNGFDKARGIDPLNPLPYEGIGSIEAMGFGRLAEAVPYFEKACELDPTGYRPVERLGQVYVDLGDETKADRLLERTTVGRVADSLVSAYLHLYRGQGAAALTIAEKALEIDPRNSAALRLIRDADLQRNDARGARARYERAFPELLQRGPPVVDPSNTSAAIDLALVLHSTGERERAARLLEDSEALFGKTVRMGPWGYWVSDVQILATRGQTREALAALQTAERSGWRGPYWRYYRDFDPALASIRQEPEFRAVFADIERDMARQRARLAALPRGVPLGADPNR